MIEVPKLIVEDPRVQTALQHPAFDSWTAPNGDQVAWFYRTHDGILVRFPEAADFTVRNAQTDVVCNPAPAIGAETVADLYHNAIIPLLDNHDGRLALHGSAVSFESKAIAFVGQSRSGKTTLAGAFARAGHPFLTEDAIRLTLEQNQYTLKPTRPILRLFADSAQHLIEATGPEQESDNGDAKRAVLAGDLLPFASDELPLGAIFLLGDGSAPSPKLTQLSAVEAFERLLQHAFLLDVEDKTRLRAHFERLGALSESAPCFALDYPRCYHALAAVIDAVRKEMGNQP